VEHDRFVGEEGRRQARQRFVLVAARDDAALDALPTLDDQPFDGHVP